jgi:hypothetical protein
MRSGVACSFMAQLLLCLLAGCQMTHDDVPALGNNSYLTAAGVVDNGESYCSGLLVAPRLVLTAAHCVYSISSAGFTPVAPDEIIFAPVVDFDKHTQLDLVTVTDVIVHPQFEPNVIHLSRAILKRGHFYDSALLVLLRPLEGTAPIPLMPELHADSPIKKGDTVTWVGYGHRRRWHRDLSDWGTQKIGRATVRHVDADQVKVTCRGDPGLRGGDSGGPALVNIGNAESPSWRVLAIYSWGLWQHTFQRVDPTLRKLVELHM